MGLQKHMTEIEKRQFMQVMKDPVLWAQTCIRSFNPKSKKIEPWIARWYQVEMMRDKSVKKVYRCGRRIGRVLPM